MHSHLASVKEEFAAAFKEQLRKDDREEAEAAAAAPSRRAAVADATIPQPKQMPQERNCFMVVAFRVPGRNQLEYCVGCSQFSYSGNVV